MTTIHTSLIDYRFRMLPSASKKYKEKFSNANFKDIDVSSLDEDDQTFTQNGIIVENKFEATDLETKNAQKARILRHQ